MSEVLFSKKAQIAYDLVPKVLESKLNRFLFELSNDRKSQYLANKIKRISASRNLFLGKFDEKYRVIFRLEEDFIEILDIVNHDRFELFMKNTRESSNERT
jgi:mRNA-degrading endonuclease RelE of RelBE toxin-antitoxin system